MWCVHPSCLKQLFPSVHLSRVSQELCRRFLEASWRHNSSGSSLSQFVHLIQTDWNIDIYIYIYNYMFIYVYINTKSKYCLISKFESYWWPPWKISVVSQTALFSPNMHFWPKTLQSGCKSRGWGGVQDPPTNVITNHIVDIYLK